MDISIKLISDGSLPGTSIILPDGKLLGKVQSIKWEASLEMSVPKLSISLAAIPVELSALLELDKDEIFQAMLVDKVQAAKKCTKEHAEQLISGLLGV